jgi:hypothetical protein
MYDLQARKHGLFAAARYCQRHELDPDDSAMQRWHDGSLTQGLLLHWDAECSEREESRQIAVAVAAAAWKIEKGPEGQLAVSPSFNALSEIIGLRINDLIDQPTFENQIAEIIPA